LDDRAANILVVSLVRQHKQFPEALQLVRDLAKSDRSIGYASVLALTQEALSQNSIEAAMELFQLAQQRGMPFDIYLYNSLIESLLKQNDHVRALNVFEGAKKCGVGIHKNLYVPIVSFYAQHNMLDPLHVLMNELVTRKAMIPGKVVMNLVQKLRPSEAELDRVAHAVERREASEAAGSTHTGSIFDGPDADLLRASEIKLELVTALVFLLEPESSMPLLLRLTRCINYGQFADLGELLDREQLSDLYYEAVRWKIQVFSALFQQMGLGKVVEVQPHTRHGRGSDPFAPLEETEETDEPADSTEVVATGDKRKRGLRGMRDLAAKAEESLEEFLLSSEESKELANKEVTFTVNALEDGKKRVEVTVENEDGTTNDRLSKSFTAAANKFASSVFTEAELEALAGTNVELSTTAEDEDGHLSVLLHHLKNEDGEVEIRLEAEEVDDVFLAEDGQEDADDAAVDGMEEDDHDVVDSTEVEDEPDPDAINANGERIRVRLLNCFTAPVALPDPAISTRPLPPT
jgi:pentatricopeptide repeat protein